MTALPNYRRAGVIAAGFGNISKFSHPTRIYRQTHHIPWQLSALLTLILVVAGFVNSLSHF
jgi:hypothetical protein